MDTSRHTLESLFAQLGLNDSNEAIVEFINEHRLSDSRRLDHADFWNSSQAQFIHEAWIDDADWVTVVDKLDNLLRD